MKVIKADDEFRIINSSVKITNSIPTDVYDLEFKPSEGYALIKSNTDYTNTEKLYGDIGDKITKIFKVWNSTDRNLGVILSGLKGQGKTISAKAIVQKALTLGLPAISISQNTPDLPKYLNSIEQDIVVLFDEFEKNFSGSSILNPGPANAFRDPERSAAERSRGGDQQTLLGTFDGLGCKYRRLWIVTCNDINMLDDNLLNRPGRFHFHLRFASVKEDEIREYMRDRLDKKYWSEIDKVVMFASTASVLNYDCLRALCTEINLGITFEDALKDINILPQGTIKLSGSATFANGAKSDQDDCYISAAKFHNKSNAFLELSIRAQGSWLGVISIPVSGLSVDSRTGKYELAQEDIPIFIPRDPKMQTPDWKITKIEFIRSSKFDDYSYT